MKTKEKIIEDFMDVIRDPVTRVELAKRNHYFFSLIYLPDHFEFKMAPLHREIFRITEDKKTKLSIITAFRGSGKSTIVALSYPLWGILGQQQKKFILIVCQTQDQAIKHFNNLKEQLENNALLKQDLGPFREERTWRSNTLIIPRYNAQIMAVSRDQAIRGLKFNENRPDLIILDDVDNINSTRTSESRDKTYSWYNTEVAPIGSRKTKTVIVGNLLHPDSMIKRLEEEIDRGDRNGIYREYPIIDGDGNRAWPGKYPDDESIEEERKNYDIYSWSREFLLKMIDDKEPIIEKSWIKRYPKLPILLKGEFHSYATGVDLAIGEKDTSDYTAMVSALVIGSGSKVKIFILPNPVNARLSFNRIVERAELLHKSCGGEHSHRFCFENDMLKSCVAPQLKEKGIETISLGASGKDKRTRLELSGNYMYQGRVFFPERGTEELEKQIFGFGVERHDDMVDAFTALILGLIENPPRDNTPRILPFDRSGFFKNLPHERQY